jgi:peptidoglycan/xylan/chitin deacetylase (PgdA/CDA1 family)
MHCHRHPERRAGRKCYACGKPVCKVCRLHRHHHIFCSEECASGWRWKDLARKADKRLKRPVSRWWMVAALLLLGAAFLWMGRFLLREYIIPAYFAPAARRAGSAEVALRWKADGALAAVAGRSPGDGALLFPHAPGSFRWLPVRRGAFTLLCPALPSPPSRAFFLPGEGLDFSPDLVRGPSSLPLVSVTFDGGAVRGEADRILALLREEGVCTTVFLTGEFIRRYPDLLEEALRDGHEVGNHTDSHPHLTTYASDHTQATAPGVSAASLRDELVRADRAMEAASGRRFAPYWRAPFGEHNAAIRGWAWKAGYHHVGWTWDSLDWREEGPGGGAPTADDMMARFRALEARGPAALNGAILLFHLGSQRAQEVQEILIHLRARGLHPVPVSTLLAASALVGVE